jgi:glycosyltransferase involved in cell wall biosynthesis
VAEAVIDVVAHFGSRLSYATIADQVVHALIACDALGNLTNLDDVWLDPALAARPQRVRSKKVLLLSDARDYLIEAMVGEYGRTNVAIFVCPNTDRLSDEHIRACNAVDRIYTPSRWCANTVMTSLRTPGPDVRVLPLGVDDPFANGWTDHEDAHDLGCRRLLHVTTDTFWPGRKGTEELLKAWKIAKLDPEEARLTIHCLPQLYGMAHQELGDLGLTDTVKLISAPLRGSTPAELCDLIARHDMLVAPSRSEGFGIMPLSALVSGTPVLTTAGTGQDEYLGEEEDGTPVLGGWMQVPTMGASELHGEDGYAPDVRADQLARVLAAGCRFYGSLLEDVGRNAKVQADWSWWARRAAWATSLVEWEAA